MAQHIDVLIVGAGQAGLSMSHCLASAGIEHVVIERGEVGERWRSERWKSLRLLTPNWMTRLPGHRYAGNDPDGFMRRGELVRLLETYGSSFAAPVQAQTRVLDVSRVGAAYHVRTDRGDWIARAVVVATGACDRPVVPAIAADLPKGVEQIVPERYCRPHDLPAGGVLVVGASATGVQLADEIHRTGRPVTVAAGRHVRVPRSYRGRDIMAWLDACGFLDERRSPEDSSDRVNRQPSLQLIGHPDHRSLDLPRLAARGVRVIGRALAVNGASVAIAPDLPQQTASAENRRRKLLARIDAYVAEAGIDAPHDPAAWAQPHDVGYGLTRLDLRATGIRTVIWATGYRRTYPWLNVPVLDEAGEIRNAGGVTPVPGLFALGLPFMRRRSSTFIDGVGRDAEELVVDIARHLNPRSEKAA
ncbi:NAD(P)/FAD-dependent oxidoreductase [Oricola sp.]|uniref:flavin-containing monooxygenase n=1 Tax=Oricola sp. TaxID=1979950 RepID=UPI0025E93CC1|nr:NAD(P)/FAD-dependent oxidoreductase [Oricola sp.]MCI5075898.1 NAD(P)/FAD-dependent oxidoreductase [Oricola sp.]